jgi:hypothetical protein
LGAAASYFLCVKPIALSFRLGATIVKCAVAAARIYSLRASAPLREQNYFTQRPQSFAEAQRSGMMSLGAIAPVSVNA